MPGSEIVVERYVVGPGTVGTQVYPVTSMPRSLDDILSFYVDLETRELVLLLSVSVYVKGKRVMLIVSDGIHD